MVYRSYYTSADGPGDDAAWSVYSELYASAESDQPIDGTQLFIERLDTEAEADEYASILQRAERGEGE